MAIKSEMTWEDLADYIRLHLSTKQKNELAVVFDYRSNKFYDLVICVEGIPGFHLTIN